jgi:cytochrome c
MASLEFNKIAAAVLTAGIIASVSGIVAVKLVEPEKLQKNAYVVPNVEPSSGKAEASKPAGPEPIKPLLASASVEEGKQVARKCAACHSFEKGGPNKVGPNLFGIFDDEIAHGRNNYAFSDALKAHSKEKWTVENLNHWLWKPQSFAKGTKMTFAGLPKAKDRADIVAYLQSLK